MADEIVSIKEFMSAVRSINRAPYHAVKIAGDDEPCYYQRKEWIDWVLDLADKAEKPCQWREDQDGNWWTECNNGFQFTDGGPKHNDMKFCCYCGKPLTEIAYDADAEESE